MKLSLQSKIAFLFLALALPFSMIAKAEAPAEKKQYNVLFIAADDLNIDINAFGNNKVNTPNIDRLAQRGVVFNHAYCQAPLCGPSRASLMTGYYPDKTGVFDLGPRFRDALPDAVTLAQMYKNNGYYTFRTGKIFHAGVPGDIGQPGHDDPASWTMTYNPIGRDKTDEYLLNADNPMLGTYLAIDCEDNEMTDAISANVAVSILRQRTGNQEVTAYGRFGGGRVNPQPFFMAVGFYRPHVPYVAPQKYFDMYPWEDIELPENPENDWDNKPHAAAWTLPLNAGASEEQQKKAIQAYYASISFVDTQVGKLLDALDEFGLSENTIIVFWSDHGYHLGEHGQWQKQTLFERAAKLPLIISVPGYSKGEKTDAVAQMVDVYPTLAELSGFEAPDDLVGKSLVPVLENPKVNWENAAYTIQARTLNPRAREGQSKYSFNPMLASDNPTIFGRSVRVQRYRYTEWDEGKLGVELYDYEKDPKEFVNLATDPKYKDMVEELSEKLHGFYK
ncbi:sulfatase [uncultured Draconibacterium sp.]|uniref:sulfatase n=1 Tax=uncultured Draconibacterium sp. TaxID=1573823 RepID=UPI002AA8223F|nr:sulfatase [uncultured Draconibacterium sp.]